MNRLLDFVLHFILGYMEVLEQWFPTFLASDPFFFLKVYIYSVYTYTVGPYEL